MKKIIINITGVRQTVVYRWVQRFKDGCEMSDPVHKTWPGRG